MKEKAILGHILELKMNAFLAGFHQAMFLINYK